MTHDIAHCLGYDDQNKICPKKDTCHRYLMHLDAKRQKLDYLTYFVIRELEENCHSYWPENEKV